MFRSGFTMIDADDEKCKSIAGPSRDGGRSQEIEVAVENTYW